MEIIIVSIGVLARNPLWNERAPVRTSHATTTLVKSGDMRLLVDPALPPELLEPRLHERTGLRADEITHVFLTNWRPVHRRGLERFAGATWWMHQAEIDAATEALTRAQTEAGQEEARQLAALIRKEQLLLDKITPAPDELADDVGLYPLPGYSPGQCGLILTEPTLTTIIAGDAVPTAAHFATGQVFPDCWNLEKAKESMLELFEVADIIIPGHDNLFVSRRSVG